jgi:predicted cupin superfamily sugar epimerase
MLTADDVIRALGLQPHPVEGGHFRETYRSPGVIPAVALPSHDADRSVGTAIYYLLTAAAVSEMHKLPGDEVFHFYLGDPLETLLLKPDGGSEVAVLGVDLLAGQVPQLVIPAGVWQGSVRGAGPHGFTLIGATMAPGFDYADYERGKRDHLTAGWPSRAAEIEKRTPQG